MKEPIKVGDEFTVDFMLNRNGGKPVCRIDGVVGFISKATKDFVTPSSTWVVSVVVVMDTFVYVKPLLKIRTPKENQTILNEKMNELKQKTEPNFPFKNRPKTNYQYKSFAELQKEKEEML